MEVGLNIVSRALELATGLELKSGVGYRERLLAVEWSNSEWRC
jgi:hypothetical protein